MKSLGEDEKSRKTGERRGQGGQLESHCIANFYAYKWPKNLKTSDFYAKVTQGKAQGDQDCFNFDSCLRLSIKGWRPI
ncbi:hypothetical protein [Acidovorax sp. M2(2025)]|uniref:hypothetical protein n=1 Tax=Acidovorax sp. M2(2025) TaxID=3411355 RepID=UPI003BF4B85C